MLVPILEWFLLRDNKRQWRSDLAALELKLRRKIVVGAASTCSAGVKRTYFKNNGPRGLDVAQRGHHFKLHSPGTRHRDNWFTRTKRKNVVPPPQG